MSNGLLLILLLIMLTAEVREGTHKSRLNAIFRRELGCGTKTTFICLTKAIKAKCLHTLLSRLDAYNYLALLGQTTNYEDVSCAINVEEERRWRTIPVRKTFSHFLSQCFVY